MKGKILIAYFSHKGENYFGGSIRNIEKGNTERVAEKLVELTGGDLFEIRAVNVYPSDYRACVERSRSELSSGARPVLAENVDVSGYDSVLLGFPNWCGTMPMAVWTFLESGDFAGKTVLPFCTHEGSGMGRSENDLQKLCPDSVIGRGLAVRGSNAGNCAAELENWLAENNG